MNRSLLFAMVVSIGATCLTGSAGALAAEVEIPIDNPGFEYPALEDGAWDYSMDDAGWGYYNNDGYLGPWNPSTAEYPNGVPEGEQAGWTEPGGEDIPGGFAQVLTDPEAVLKVDWTYTLKVEVGNAIGYEWGGYKVQLLAGGTPHTPGDGSDYTGAVTGGTLLAEDDNSQAIPDGTFVTSTVIYTYSPKHADLVGQPLQIRLLALGYDEVEFDNVRLTGSFTPGAPIVDAGPDMISWSGQAVQLDPNVVNRDATPLTFAWTADPADGVVFEPGPNVEAPTVTITKDTDNPSVVTLTLAVNNEGSTRPDVTDTLTIDVYDDACVAARLGAGLIHENDLDENCIINFGDFALLAETWLDDITLTEPVPK